MTLELIFLGSGSAFTVGANNYQSNMILKLGKKTLLIDAGSDVRHSLHAQGLSYQDVRDVYISHVHSDHIGGLEWLALTTKYDPSYEGKPKLILSESIADDLWEESLKGGLRTVQTELSTLNTFFNVEPLKRNHSFIWQNIEFFMVQAVHVVSGYELMPCFGLFFQYNKQKIYITSDTQYCYSQMNDYYKKADVIFHDCETTPFRSGVHAHYEDLKTLPDEFKKKFWLYHYNPGDLPDAVSDGFLGFVKNGQRFVF